MTPDEQNMCDNFTRTDTCIDVSCWIVFLSGSDVLISIVSTVVSGLMAFSIINVCHRCVVSDKMPVLGTTSGSCDVV